MYPKPLRTAEPIILIWAKNRFGCMIHSAVRSPHKEHPYRNRWN